ncbi:tetratricopeptide repeat protein [Actinoplanes sp. NBRC 103695]|uniref:tetratricopeptide repeat protein n=1 Tax=Actinoplanes sp. NBRC 103695 TaxID=3032202 RepID=UPI0024A311BE|nr:tetratricopeptide repeat protein [Actinoplanes sp. NBRC 103695]GLZ02462.1 hypothetical protein Acsp02_97130 [Actinoplanes sp. NBRC 103695]
MSAWPRWSLAGEPAALAKYVQPDAVAAHLALPGASSSDPAVRLAEVYRVLVAAGIRYAHEAPSDEPGRRQVIRTPEQVLWSPRHGTCLDLALVLAGAALVAGLHPIVIIIAPAGGEAAHALVGFWMADDDTLPLGDPDGVWSHRPPQLTDLVQTHWDEPSDLVVVDPVGFTTALPGTTVPGTGLDLPAAVQRGAQLLAERDWLLGVDITKLWRAQDALPLPSHPAVDPLRAGYVEPPDDSPLQVLRADYGLIPFVDREELAELQAFCRRVAVGDHTGVVALTGAGGAGKTRLALELSETLSAAGWHAGLLRPAATPDDLAWLGSGAAPLLVVVDYADAQVPRARHVLAALQARLRTRPAVVLLTARSAEGSWWPDIITDLRDNGHPHEVLQLTLPPHHPSGAAILRETMSQLGQDHAEPPDVKHLEGSASGQLTTLDFVLLGWSTVINDDPAPLGLDALYDSALKHELSYWRRTWARIQPGTEAPDTLLRKAATLVTLLSPPPDEAAVADCLSGLTQAGPDRVHDLARTLVVCLGPKPGEPLSIRPGPLADHMIRTLLRRDRAVLSTTLAGLAANAAGAALFRLNRATRTADATEAAAALMVETVRAVPDRWRQLFMVAYFQTGPALTAMMEVVGDAGIVPLDELAGLIPPEHPALWHLGLQTDRLRLLRLREDPGVDPELIAGAVSSLAVWLSKAGDLDGALTAATDSVRLARELAAGDARHRRLLARTLSNLSNRLSDLNRHEAALEAARESADIERAIASERHDHELGIALDILAVRENKAGNAAAALTASSEAVAHHRAAAPAPGTDRYAEYAASLYSHSSHLAAAGQHTAALDAAKESVEVARIATKQDPVHVVRLAEALRTLAKRQQDAGDAPAAVASIEEAVSLSRFLATANPGQYLPMLGEFLLVAVSGHDASGDRATAQHRLLEAVDVLRDYQRDDADPARLVQALLDLSQRHAFDGRFDASLEIVREAVATCRASTAAATANVILLAACLHALSEGLALRLDHAGALRAAQECATLIRTQPVEKKGLAGALHMLASRQRAVGNDRAASAALVEAANLYRDVAGGGTPDVGLPRCLKELTDLHVAGGDIDAAFSAVTETVDAYRRLGDPLLEEEFASALNALSFLQRRTGDVHGSLTTNIEAVARLRQLPSTRGIRKQLAPALSNLSNRYAEVRSICEAREAIDEAVEIFQSLDADQDPELHPYFMAALANRSDRYRPS